MVNGGAQTAAPGTFERVSSRWLPCWSWRRCWPGSPSPRYGILLLVGYRMIDQHSLEFFQSPDHPLDFFVIVAVIVTALTVSLIAAPGVGIVLGSASTRREQAQLDPAPQDRGRRQFSKVVRHDQELSILLRNGRKTVIVELQGSLFSAPPSALTLALEPRSAAHLCGPEHAAGPVPRPHRHPCPEQIKDRLERGASPDLHRHPPRPAQRPPDETLPARRGPAAGSLAGPLLPAARPGAGVDRAALLVAEAFPGDNEGPPLELAELEQLLGWKPAPWAIWPISSRRGISRRGARVFTGHAGRRPGFHPPRHAAGGDADRQEGRPGTSAPSAAGISW